MRAGEVYSAVKPGEYVEGARFGFLVNNRSGFWREITSHIPTEDFIRLAASEKDSKLLRRLAAIETREYSKKRKDLIDMLKKRVRYLEGLPEQDPVPETQLSEGDENPEGGTPAAGLNAPPPITTGAAAGATSGQGGAPGNQGGGKQQPKTNGPSGGNT